MNRQIELFIVFRRIRVIDSLRLPTQELLHHRVAGSDVEGFEALIHRFRLSRRIASGWEVEDQVMAHRHSHVFHWLERIWGQLGGIDPQGPPRPLPIVMGGRD